ncbi:hypothetical protein TEK04_19640 [Klenkia sp. LSe6-5]|uniref:Uncharacterized protein n=1 Tax=Klenkia sesuvii TaxID=3103137 RepID=A0ABU8DYM5_9ACTN
MATKWIALVPIFFRGVRAYNAGDTVPDANVQLHSYDTQGLVQQVTVPDPGGPPADPVDLRTAALLADPASATSAAGRAASVSANALALAGSPDLLIAGAITRDANGAATSAPVVWPDGDSGTYTATTVSTAFPGAVDAYTVTKGNPVTKTYTQAAVTRDATGAVTQRPALAVS